ncbi:MAG: glycosyltransferase [Pseudomonadota bacterium]|nr:glycosyltransferase [Pseudomonadota bacterium]
MNDRVTPLVSVVIPNYNHARYLGRALQSLLDQTYTNWEAIIIDNHSTDNTDEVISSFTSPQISYLKIHNNGVIAKSRNAGIRAANGEWIAFLDSDDWWTSDKLQVCFDYINEKVDLVYHDMQIITDNPQPFSRKIIKSWQVSPPVLIDLLLKGNAIANSSVVVRKSLLEQIGGINECVEMKASEDYNTWLRIAQLSEQFVYLQHRLGYYLKHNHSISQKDMSIPMRHAVAELSSALRESHKLKLEANLRFASLQFNYLTFKYSKIKLDLMFVLCHGSVAKRIKTLILLMKIIFNRFSHDNNQ